MAAPSLADEVVMMNTARVVFVGSVDDVRDDQALTTQHLGVF
jgi:ABC-type branched-subunit amino acid transport system ATPase component